MGKQVMHIEVCELTSSAEVRNVWRYTTTASYACVAWFLINHQGNILLPGKWPFARLKKNKIKH
jgi:hypothetical protein